MSTCFTTTTPRRHGYYVRAYTRLRGQGISYKLALQVAFAEHTRIQHTLARVPTPQEAEPPPILPRPPYPHPLPPRPPDSSPLRTTSGGLLKSYNSCRTLIEQTPTLTVSDREKRTSLSGIETVKITAPLRHVFPPPPSPQQQQQQHHG